MQRGRSPCIRRGNAGAAGYARIIQRVNRRKSRRKGMKVKDLLKALEERGMDEEILIESEPDKYREKLLETVWIDERGIVLSARLMPD
ncbi:hypothetical protein Bxe_A3757 [Paraburkholderia xenovorans LB400]|uniref:Uncharacterized protein n=2 Tax=Paraburkholderia xenovorans TaxID=36873 RepID=Q144K4_PARXL|nr:hypothetical protein Bxe_A3757 [Paraburkholderia xenovorans LB400]